MFALNKTSIIFCLSLLILAGGVRATEPPSSGADGMSGA